MKKMVKSPKSWSLKRSLILICIFFVALSMLYAMRLDMGVGAESIDTTVPFLKLDLSADYFKIENDFVYRHEFGIIDTLGMFLKLDSKLTPFFGVSSCWGYNQDEGFFIEDKGLILNAGLSFYHEKYAVTFQVGEYITFDGKISEIPIIKFSCSIKIGEW